ncbi:TasA family protein [Kineococcus sp. LSe6-4]|uniref:TasA family protein n=1 Tax=Kineococcus halophytocola TaxID=3234027 RepID=A0ABV4GXA0_9ACTN
MSVTEHGTPEHPTTGHRCRGTRRGARQVAGIAATVAAGVALTSGGVYAALTAQAFNGTAQQVRTGTLLLTLSPTAGSAGFTSVVGDLAPGDVVNRYVQLQNTGTLPGQGLTLRLADSSPTLLTTSATKGLQVTVNECPVAWTVATGTCTTSAPGVPGTGVPVLAQTPAATLASTSVAPPSLSGPGLAPGATRYFQVSLTLPSATNDDVSVNGVAPTGSVQGLSAGLTWTFATTQRAATTTNS